MFRDIKPNAPLVIIDDAPASNRLLDSSLQSLGLGVIHSHSDPVAGLHWLRHNPWSLLLLDLDSERAATQGLAILRELAHRDRVCQPILVLTAQDDLQNRWQALELGANDYLTKPLELPEILVRMHHCLLLSQTTLQLRQANAALQIGARQRTQQLNDNYAAVIRALARASSYRDDDTGRHIRRIGTFAGIVARHMGMPWDWCELIEQAALMHDVGKIGIPDQILLKPGVLDAHERLQMQTHAQIGFDILQDDSNSPLTEMAAQVALNHHERWNGSGYPHGLSGCAIPLAARIVAVCDVYDALRQPRAYKLAWDAERSRTYIRDHSGHHFDPDIVAVFEQCVDRFEAVYHKEGIQEAAQQPGLALPSAEPAIDEALCD